MLVTNAIVISSTRFATTDELPSHSLGGSVDRKAETSFDVRQGHGLSFSEIWLSDGCHLELAY